MSHFTVLVIGDNVEEQLQPYHEYECTGIEDKYVVFVPAQESLEELQKQYEDRKDDYESLESFIEDYHGYHQNEHGQWGRTTNPNAKWDWWVIGGRWSGFLKAKEGVVHEIGEPGAFGNEPKDGGADIITKGGVDWDGMRNEAKERAAKRYDLVSKAIDGLAYESWESVRNLYEDIDKAREHYHNQAIVKAFKKVTEKHTDMFGWFAEVDEYLCDRETYIERAANSAITTYAFVKDSKWYQKGEMGWWGMSTNEVSQDEWNKQFWEMIQSLPDDTELTVVDCHI